MWIYLTHPSGDESNKKCHLGRHLGSDWMRSYPSRPVTFRFLSRSHSRRLLIAVNADVKSNKKTIPPHFSLFFQWWMHTKSGNLANSDIPIINGSNHVPVLISDQLLLPARRIVEASTVWRLHGLENVNFFITFSLIKSSASAHKGTVIFCPEKLLEKYSSSSFAETHLMDFTVASDLMAQKELEE